jgi:arginine repressor
MLSAAKSIVDSSDESNAATIASKLLNHFKLAKVDTEDTEVLYCLIVAAGTLASKFESAKKSVREAAPSIGENIALVKSHGVAKLQESISEFESVNAAQ